jgi:hypothetical protein
MPKYLPLECPKCGAELPKSSPKGGRPTRWCSEGCQRSGEAEMARLQSMLRKFEAFLFDRRMEGCPPERLERRVGVIAELQGRYDHLAGVPPQ